MSIPEPLESFILAIGVGTLAEWLTLVAAGWIAIAANILHRHALKHQIRESVRLGLLDLTTGEVAEARDRIGTLLYAKNGHRAVSPPEVIESYYKLIWALERANVTASALKRHRKDRHVAASAWAWHLKEIAWNVWLLGIFSDARTLNLDDRDARLRLGTVLRRFPVKFRKLAEDDRTAKRWAALSLVEFWSVPEAPHEAVSWTSDRIKDMKARGLVSEEELELSKRLRACVRHYRRSVRM